MPLSDLHTLGRSGLPVSPLALGTMTFGTQRWGSPDDVSEAIFNAYIDAGGNFLDTADVYSGGRSEELLGGYVAERGLRDRVALATKYSFNGTPPGEPRNPLAGGNSRKNLARALDGSLRRLRTDYVDLYWLHVWDMVTPVEEVLQAFGDFVRAGKVRYFGFSNVPAWYVARASTLAAVHNAPGPIALQLEYSLVQRGIEQEFVPAAQHLGLGIVPWSPLAGGFLTGKYERSAERASDTETDQGRLSGSNPFQGKFTKFTEHNWRVLDALRAVAQEVDRSPAQVALAWVLAQPGVAASIIGASKTAQLDDNLAALDVQLTAEQLRVLGEASATEAGSPAAIFTPELQRGIFGGVRVAGWR